MGTNTRAYRQMRAALLATLPPVCAWCGKLIDRTLPGTHPEGPTLDHIVPRAQGGRDHPSNLQPMHRRCNTVRGNRPLPTTNSRQW